MITEDLEYITPSRWCSGCTISMHVLKYHKLHQIEGTNFAIEFSCLKTHCIVLTQINCDPLQQYCEIHLNFFDRNSSCSDWIWLQSYKVLHAGRPNIISKSKRSHIPNIRLHSACHHGNGQVAMVTLACLVLLQRHKNKDRKTYR